MPQVEVKRIHWSSAKAFALDVLAAFERCGLSKTSAEMLAAHACLSSGWGGMKNNSGLANYMITGIKATDLEHQDWIELHGTEWHSTGHNYVGAMMKWRAFSTLDESCKAMLEKLQQPRYTNSLSMLIAGDENYMSQVGIDGWYTAPTEDVVPDWHNRLEQIKKWENEDYNNE